MSNPQVTGLQQQISALNAQLAAVQAQVAALQAQNTALTSQLAIADAKITELETPVVPVPVPPPVDPIPVPTPIPTPVPIPTTTLAANTARNIGGYANNDPQFNKDRLSAINITDYSGLTLDAKRKRIVLFGGGHGPSQETDLRYFDLTTDKWDSLYKSTDIVDMTLTNLDITKGRYIKTNHPTARHSYNLTLVRGDKLHLLQPRGMPDDYHIGSAMYGGPAADNGSWGGSTASYDFNTGEWSYGKLGSMYDHDPQAPWYFASAAVLDPTSQLILIAGQGIYSGPGGLWAFNPDDDTYVKLADCDVGGSPDFVYFPPNDKFYVLQSDGRVWEVTFNRTTTPLSATITSLQPTGTAPSAGNGFICAYAYDPVNKIIGGNVTNGTFYAFDPMTHMWTASLMDVEAGSVGVPNCSFHCLEYDPTSDLYLFLHTPAWDDKVNVPSTWLFKYDKKTAKAAPTPILPVGTTLQSLLDVGGTVSLGSGEQSLGGVITQVGTTLTSSSANTTLLGGAEVQGKGIIVVEVDSVISNLTLANATVNDGNGAGIRHDAGSLKVNNVTFVGNQDGYLGSSDVAFDGCVFINNGKGDGQTHAAYIGNGTKLATVNNCNFSGTKIGHHLKSRSVKTVVTKSFFNAATESYSIDFPWGGNANVSGCSITQGPDTDNPVMINFGTEGQPYQDNQLSISDTNFASSGVTAIGVRLDASMSSVPVTFTNCNFTGVAIPAQGGKVTYINCTKDGQPYNG